MFEAFYMIKYDFWSFSYDYIQVWYLNLFIWLYMIAEAFYKVLYDLWSFLTKKYHDAKNAKSQFCSMLSYVKIRWIQVCSPLVLKASKMEIFKNMLFLMISIFDIFEFVILSFCLLGSRWC